MRAAGTPADDTRELPSFEEVKADKLGVRRGRPRRSIVRRTRSTPGALVQRTGDRVVVQNPPALPITPADMDRIYDLPYQRRAHPVVHASRSRPSEMMDSVTIMRGCFGGCTFCSITAHQGRIIQSRSQGVGAGARCGRWARTRRSKGVVSDIGGPTANMYQMRCTRPEVEAMCKRLSCVFPTICKLLGTDHGPLIELMKKAREAPGIKKVFVACGIRMDLARSSPEYIDELAAHHVGGHLKVAPEHISDRVLEMMKKPAQKDFERFAEAFDAANAARRQEAVPRALFHRVPSGQRPRRDDRAGGVPEAERLPAATRCRTSSRRRSTSRRACTTRVSIPHTLEPVPVAKNLRDRKHAAGAMQFFKPENYFEVRQARSSCGPRGPDRHRLRRPDPRDSAARGARRAARARRSRLRPLHHERGRRPEDWDAFTGYRDREQVLPDATAAPAPRPRRSVPSAIARIVPGAR